jgi:hypothetical protein
MDLEVVGQVRCDIIPFIAVLLLLLCVKGGISLMHCSLFKFTLVLNTVLLLWKLFSSPALYVQRFSVPVSAVEVKIVLLLDALQLLKLFVFGKVFLKHILY